MKIIRWLDSYIDAFMRLSPVTKRVLTTIVCVLLLCLCGPLGAAGYDKLVNYVACHCRCWSVLVNRLLVRPAGALILLAWWLRIFR